MTLSRSTPDSPPEPRAARDSPTPNGPILVLDTGSPTVSLAIGDRQAVLATRTIDLRQSSERLLRNIADALAEADCHRSDLGGVAALGGPGSFTGLRVGLGTVMGLHQALGVPATALPTLPILARAASGAAGGDDRAPEGETVVAMVDALRGTWMAQTFAWRDGQPTPLDVPTLHTLEALYATGHTLVGFGVEAALAAASIETPSEPGTRRRIVDPSPLAPLALAPAWDGPWDPGKLVQPIYFRPPAVTPPKRKARPSTGLQP